jgi:ribosomal protein S12 methylthiotransferase
VEFDHLGVFTYSHEEGTAAYRLADDVPAAEKTRRERHLMQVQRQIVSRRHAGRIGEHARVFVDGPAPDHSLVLVGRLEGHAPDIDPVVYLTDCGPDDVQIGALCETEIIEARGYDLVARPL